MKTGSKTIKVRGTAKDSCQNDIEAALTEETALNRAEEFIGRIPEYPGRFRGRGIVICGGGSRYFPCAWVSINHLRRRLGCDLPIQLWYLGTRELDNNMRKLVAPLQVDCVDALKVRQRHKCRILRGWELKSYSIIHSPFKEVLFLDADNLAIRNPEYLFETQPYLDSGAVFWPDYLRLGRTRKIWSLCGVKYRDEPEFETGQIVVNKQRCWQELQLTMWYNEHSDFFYRYIHGDKETFHLAWRKLSREYSMPPFPIHPLPRVMCQHDFEGKRLFQHRNLAKWSLFLPNKSIPDFTHEKDCFGYLKELGAEWSGRPDHPIAKRTKKERQYFENLISGSYLYVRVGYDRRPMSFQSNGRIGIGAAACEIFWDLKCNNGDAFLDIKSDQELTCRVKMCQDGIWRGRWERYEKMPIEIVPSSDSEA